MPQVDLETLVCGGDRKIECKSLIGDLQQPQLDKLDPLEAPSDFPVESFQLREEDELEWFDRNAFYFNERKDSQKGNSNPNSISNHNPTNSTSQRFSLNFTSNTSIIGPKPQKSSYLNSKSRRHGRPPRPRFFPKKPSRSGKSITVTEPSSPKVSCIGRVRSNRSKNRRCPSGRRPTEVKSKPENKTGFWNCLKAILQFSCGNNGSGVDIDESRRPKDSPSNSPPRWSFAEREQKIPASAPLGDPPGLGGMKRFASGRKSESWARSDLDSDEDSVVESDATDHQQHSIWRRRAVDPPKKIDSLRDWECEGPASV
ncbi:uncharacterized protein LOC122652341 [Telopea speciosissima]|uniref:uncharacterized protein LOC122652341 n=1 Tax=Telopea speciosissima TaxID=54955 RepID=UPI001CC72365|nr:uncharacterized protein LOC122652341 [Telopea speciosissima]